jgi:hypothetical protein
MPEVDVFGSPLVTAPSAQPYHLDATGLADDYPAIGFDAYAAATWDTPPAPQPHHALAPQPPQQPPTHFVQAHAAHAAAHAVAQTQAASRGGFLDSYNSLRAAHECVTDMPVALLRAQGELHPAPKLFVYVTSTQGIRELTHANAVFAGLHPARTPELLLDVRKTMFDAHLARCLAAQTYDNTVTLLPFVPATVEAYDHAWRAECAGHLVLLACADPLPVGGELAPETLRLVALGVMLGDRVYANTLDPAHRVRGVPQALGTDNSHAPQHYADTNALLGPVHWVTSLLSDDAPSRPVTLAQFMPPGFEAPPLTAAPALGDHAAAALAPLGLLCRNVRFSVASPPPAAASDPREACEWAVAQALAKMLAAHSAPRTRVAMSYRAMDAARAQRVQRLAALAGLPLAVDEPPVTMALHAADHSNRSAGQALPAPVPVPAPAPADAPAPKRAKRSRRATNAKDYLKKVAATLHNFHHGYYRDSEALGSLHADAATRPPPATVY